MRVCKQVYVAHVCIYAMGRWVYVYTCKGVGVYVHVIDVYVDTYVVDGCVYVYTGMCRYVCMCTHRRRCMCACMYWSGV